MMLLKKKYLIFVMTLQVVFFLSPVASAEYVVASFAGGGLWIYDSANISGDWHGNSEGVEGPDLGQVVANFRDGMFIYANISFTSPDCGNFSISATGLLWNPDLRVNGSFVCQGEQYDLNISFPYINGRIMSGAYHLSSEQLSYSGEIRIERIDVSLLTQITPSTPENILFAEPYVYADFGVGGIWMYRVSHGDWTMLTPSNPENMVAASVGKIYAEFGAGGIWEWNGSSWRMLTPSNPENMVAAPYDRLYAEFGAGGIWEWNGSSWTQLTPSNPEKMVLGIYHHLYAEFEAGGIWRWDGSSWVRISDANPENMVARYPLLYADFGSGGLYVWNDISSSWTIISNASPENMVAGGNYKTLFADFGAGGLYMWNNDLWTMLTPSNPMKIEGGY